MATLLKEEVAEGQRQLVALASAAVSPAGADGPRALTMQELEARDPTLDITALLQQKRCVIVPMCAVLMTSVQVSQRRKRCHLLMAIVCCRVRCCFNCSHTRGPTVTPVFLGLQV